MTIIYLRNIARFVFLVLFQVLILNNIQFSGFINPYFYIYFILLLPFETPPWLLLLSSFVLGITLDAFTHTFGLNAAACVLMAFARPFVINAISTGTEFMIGHSPSLRNQGLKWFAYYSIILVLVHHFALFFLEIFRFTEFFQTLLRALLSSLFTLLLVFIAEYLSIPREKSSSSR
ncbi:MAG: rod shape-determining protein MreD [Bacteroidetes bacterium]|nr:rod shape-determining protein MreD [Bacteroidota bacterium]